MRSIRPAHTAVTTIVHMADVLNEAHETALLGALAKVKSDNEKHYITVS